jgi:uncharacterized membrane protein YfcA
MVVLIGVVTGVTTVLFGFGGGFVTVPVIVWVDADVGGSAGTVAVATSAVVMVVNAAVATAATPRRVLARLRGRARLLGRLATGGLVGALLALAIPGAVTSWGFVVYLALTLADLLARPGFLRPPQDEETGPATAAIRTAWGTPIGALAAVLGVGGSVMTVPLLRRSGLPMAQAAALANPLTLAISIPASAVFLLATRGAEVGGALLPVGIVDLGAAALLLTGAIPVIVLLRRRPPRLPDRAHAWGYLGLLVVVLAAMVTSLL